MEIADIVAQRGTCPRKSVGAVIVKESRVISIGYNGAPPGLPHCTDVGCGGKEENPRFIPGELTRHTEYIYPNGCTRALHAEMNAVAFAARLGVPTHDAALYCTCATCANCAALLVAAGISRFVYFEDYRLKDGIDLLNDAGVEVVKWKP